MISMRTATGNGPRIAAAVNSGKEPFGNLRTANYYQKESAVDQSRSALGHQVTLDLAIGYFS
jgi:hypothetical protein